MMKSLDPCIDIKKSQTDETTLDSEDFATLVEVFRTLLKWQEEKDRRMREKSDGCDHHQ